ncbi:FAD-dependent monooxygenase [Mycolicibacterium komossense]|uniref:FAD-dependent monooxygenase n=1 Tax=Mycolicibacterium komossense TaxID=1779 RepID=A0ABT3C9X2_9MYCO|nr:FAD-dependent monooxygenase [Mycolicibacterium komossense]MCV7226260.1 FAD-dependent monooxygenase [Mycolicibacterium komossense]
MNAEKKVLICGGGIAGPACAYWLQKYGYIVVIAEKAASLRDGGQNVDVKGAGQRVIEEMGLAEIIEAKNTMEEGHKYLGADGRVIGVFPKGALGTLTRDFEILRGDLAQIFYDATHDRCEYRFNTAVAHLEDKEDCVSVTFDDGAVEEFEFVVCAEGIGSSTRQMVMAEHVRFRYLGAYMAYFNIPKHPGDDHWARVVHALGGTFLALRPGTDTETTALVTFLADDVGVTPNDPTSRKELLEKALTGRGAIADRVRADLDAVGDLYFGPMSQVEASRWSRGRVVLLGDAAYCPTPFTGSGTGLALVGAYILAGEVKDRRNLAEAFAAYERIVRPYVETAQKQLNPRIIRFLHVKTRLGVAIMHTIFRVLALDATQRLAKLAATKRDKKKPADDFLLPVYT